MRYFIKAIILTGVFFLSCQEGKRSEVEKKAETKSQIFLDPVCNMKIDIRKTKYMTDYKNKRYYFCSSECLDSFRNNPEKYIMHYKEKHDH